MLDALPPSRRQQVLSRVIGALRLLRTALEGAQHPAILCSFGKDSMALVALASRFGVRRVLYLEDRDEIVDEEHKARVIARYKLDVIPMRSGRGVFYSVGGEPYLLAFPFVSPSAALPVPTNVNPWSGIGPFMCIDDRLRAAHGAVLPHPVDVVIHGFKRCDFEGGSCRMFVDRLPEPLRTAAIERIGATDACTDLVDHNLRVVYPLLDWSHDDVWDFLEAYNIPTSPLMYDGRARRPFTHQVCYRCHDPNGPAIVRCPKTGESIMNLGGGGEWEFGLAYLTRLGILTPEEHDALQSRSD